MKSHKPFVLNIIWIIWILWIALIILTNLHHEMWHDELRAWSIVKNATYPWDLYHLTRYEGHPMLWFLILYIAKFITLHPAIMQILNAAFFATAMVLLIAYAPFPHWWKILPLLTGVGLFEYSVVARNYSLSVLCLIAYAVISKGKWERPIPSAIALALTIQSNLIAAIAALWITAAWILETAFEQRFSKQWYATLILPITLIATSTIFCLLWIYPPHDSLIPQHHHKTLSELSQALIQSAFNFANAFDDLLHHAFWGSPLQHSPLIPIVGQLLLIITLLGLLGRPLLAFTFWGMIFTYGILFNIFSPGYYRHEAYFLYAATVFYWIAHKVPWQWSHPLTHLLHRLALYGALPILMISGSFIGIYWIKKDLQGSYCAAAEIKTFIRKNPSLQEAIIVADPWYLAEAFSYYLPNPIFIPRENRFAQSPSWSNQQVIQKLNLSDILAAAQKLLSEKNKPILIALRDPTWEKTPEGQTTYVLGRSLHWTESERQALLAHTTPLARFYKSLHDFEWCTLYLLR
jgi:hypothetical protein